MPVGAWISSLVCEPLKTGQDLPGEVGGFDTTLQGGTAVADLPELRRRNLLNGYDLRGTAPAEMVVNRMDRDAIEPLEEGPTGAEASDVAEDLSLKLWNRLLPIVVPSTASILKAGPASGPLNPMLPSRTTSA